MSEKAQQSVMQLVVLVVGVTAFILGTTIASNYRGLFYGVGTFCVAMFANVYLLPALKAKKAE